MSGTVQYTSERYSDAYLVINSCGEQVLSEADAGSLRANGRVDVGLQYIAAGRGYYREDGVVHTVPAGHVLLHFPGVRQDYFFKAADAATLRFVHFTGTAAALLSPLESEKTVVIAVRDTARFEQTFSRMIAAYNAHEPYFETTCAGYLLVLLSLLLQSVRAGAPGSRHTALDAVCSYMHLHFNEPIDLDRYAAMCYVSRDRFMHLFKAGTGVSPYHFQLRIRMERAAEMLTYTGVSVAACAAAVGFHDPAYFCRVFKKFTGKMPSAYKK